LKHAGGFVPDMVQELIIRLIKLVAASMTEGLEEVLLSTIKGKETLGLVLRQSSS